MTNFISKINSPVGIAELVGENDEDGSLDEVGANETEGFADSIVYINHKRSTNDVQS